MKKYKFNVIGRKYNHSDTYTITFRKEGWHVSHIAINGDCDKTGEPTLFANLKQDQINYPSGLGFLMEEIHEKAESGDYKDDQIQAMLDKAANWVDQVSQFASPSLE